MFLQLRVSIDSADYKADRSCEYLSAQGGPRKVAAPSGFERGNRTQSKTGKVPGAAWLQWQFEAKPSEACYPIDGVYMQSQAKRGFRDCGWAPQSWSVEQLIMAAPSLARPRDVCCASHLSTGIYSKQADTATRAGCSVDSAY